MDKTSNGFLAEIRPCARAVILRRQEILVQVKSKPGRADYLSLPGGKQDPGESLIQCVIRECAEEIGAEITVGPLLHVAETLRDKPGGQRHQLDILFACTVPQDYVPQLGLHPDLSQTATAWVPLDEAIPRLSPAFGSGLMRADRLVYLGFVDG
ncbi:ADP-ribose pyrophosphatase YjhB, NUDIX family [Roseovarius tolerans]|uniref:ADP-ribose pyrophosphatase YjhB, NUDIX family n=1 Tax=Roseovarius tolerans TaxID=74031 RepID=A0A1H8AF23_9RHOB|nr:NUDIX domain-containing protein [Roseovarius tolerans]SEM68534.1 ADP-ribose pyrophosphatase YjhB, NUDIX family [Roseovarius tolerans]